MCPEKCSYACPQHIPNYTSQTVSNLDPRQHNHPDNAETQNNVGGDVAWRAKLPAMTQFHWLSRTNVWNVCFILLILVITKMEETSLLGANKDGQRGFRIIIRTWFQSPTALVYYPLVLYTQLATKDGAGQCKCLWFQSFFVIWRQQAARRELAGTPDRTILFYKDFVERAQAEGVVRTPTPKDPTILVISAASAHRSKPSAVVAFVE
jgi:hypothetical protein